MQQKENTKSTVLVITTGFIVIYFFTSWHFMLIAAIVTGVLGISDRVSKLIHITWMGLARLLSYIIPNILLALIFYLILFPLAMISRLQYKDPLMLSSAHKSYWVKDEQIPSKESFEKTW
ncbi:MAG: hypothetical protein EA359_14475 [Balneolaceae bacterium]|nr:MAG: hypothetical protein EA359_14475 [Balneolaceae bacterium]